MNGDKHFRHEGYQLGFLDGKRTGGKVNKAYIANFFDQETQGLSAEDSLDFKEGWQAGFMDAVNQAMKNMLKSDDFLGIHLYEFD